MMRMSINRSGAARPIWLYVGRNPRMSVAPPINEMDSVSSARLPDAIADPPQHQTADWSREKSQREGRECAELLGSRIGGREELMADLAGEIAVNGEVK